MEDCSVSDKISEICWFCKKGRHEECMKEIPINAKSDGPHLIQNLFCVNAVMESD